MTPSTIEDANKCSTLSPVKSKSLPSTPTDQSNNIMVVLPNKEKNNTTKEVEKNGSFIKPNRMFKGMATSVILAMAIEDANKCSTLSSSVKKSLPSTPTDQSNIMVVVPNKEKYNTTKDVEKNGCSSTEPQPYEVQGNGNGKDGGEDDDDNIDDDNNKESGQANDIAKRFLPAYKKPNAALTFPEKMMNLMNYATTRVKQEKHFCVSWLPDGKAFVIYDIKDFTKDVVPKFFKASKFCSFTRKLYRWGFRQLNRGIGPDEPIIFGNEFFQQDHADLMVNMRSITAASIRKRESNLLRHMHASKKQGLLAWNGIGNAAASAATAAGVDPHQLKQIEREVLFNSNLYGQQHVFEQSEVQQQNALAAAAGGTAGVVPGVVSPRFGLGGLGNGLSDGGGLGGDTVHGITATELSQMSNLQLQQLFRNCSTLPSNFTTASTQLSNITTNESSFNTPINNGSMFDMNSDININGSIIGNNNGMNGLNNSTGPSLHGLGLNGSSSTMNQNHSLFGASFPSNPMYGNNNMNKHSNTNFGYNNRQQYNMLNNINLQQQLHNNNNTSLATNDPTSMNNNNNNYIGNINKINNNHNNSMNQIKKLIEIHTDHKNSENVEEQVVKIAA
eukprot:CAMPEP_0170775574 /NCGR_PEP_ID=MMETSP0733-20121128/10665_1 /TAXON_ID=186038 /ORGANISM="Fragilariopsis kerguelensis, Strain L26-C5" /LENGTH=615 /DNA_ID=CAMNT_0011118409 /DNA_START=31 /DNA_END=1879 /DNA_ORIENTATION=+